ncbi:DUF2520 domain-containing protein [Aestuariicella hydrocarbonica]|uniref:DUF2520 domain-containing protein n=1 Tax=Pseudomaricurvus hydrocarbonicus TaxID=1470433 RepID=A0A9E5MH73_9GAMM|nr:Rossmann-like and DUF2520 domain-containing protein [Aestuariicella hydrocarbonica]NHO65601.1 DUF2520 domain-containing protein [Aestuariicella hydrocarbonica]
MKTLNLVGAGKLGQTLAHLWHAHATFTIQQVITRSLPSAKAACEFIGAGEAVTSVQQMTPANVWLIATPDGNIAKQVQALHKSQLLTPDTVVFHCSGALNSSCLKPQASEVYQVASIHPIHSFATPAESKNSFHGSFCGYEGHPEALATLLPAFEHIGAQLFAIDGEHKTLYHAASVMACNYLVGLMDASLECFEAAGVSRNQAQQLLLPITHQTLDNALTGSPEAALTGPISRGDVDTVRNQLQQLAQLKAHKHSLLAEIYQVMGQQTVRVAEKQQRSAPPQDLAEIKSLLQQSGFDTQ